MGASSIHAFQIYFICINNAEVTDQIELRVK